MGVTLDTTTGQVTITAPESVAQVVREGPQGPAGVSIDWQGHVPTWGDLPAVGEPGDAWLVDEDGHGAFWDTDTEAWIDGGRFQGPPGAAGPAIGGILTTRGDLVARDATTAVRVPVGAVGQVLTPDVSAPAGVRWATPVERSDLLREAVWHVDARDALADRLPDLTGRGRDAIFGAGAAAPLVLPWDGEDYVHVPASAAVAANRVRAGIPTAVFLPLGGWAEVDAFVSNAEETWLFNASLPAGVNRISTLNGNLSAYFGTAGAISWPVEAANRRRVYRFVMNADGTSVELLVDGVSQGAKALSVAYVPSIPTYVDVGRYNITNGTGFCRIYRFATSDGAYVLDPRKVNATYTTIQGGAGGNWTITRAATGYKTAVVDRPLLLFGGGQTLTVGSAVAGSGTRLRSRRAFGDGGTIGTVETVHNGTAPILSGITEEYLAEVIFSRVLTAAEIAQVSQELAGVPHAKQADPHPGYPPLVAGTTAAALPANAREGTIAVLADNSIAIRTRTGGWRTITTTTLPGSPP